jgi:hypothetical protein
LAGWKGLAGQRHLLKLTACMKSPFTFAALAAAALLSLVIANTILPFPDPESDTTHFRFEARLTSTTAGTVQLYFQTPELDFNEANSVRRPLAAGTQPVLVNFPLVAESIRGLRLDPNTRAGTFTVTDALIRRPDGSVYHRFAPADFVAANQIARTSANGNVLTIETTPGALDPYLIVQLGVPQLPLARSLREVLQPFVWRALPIFAVLAAALWWWSRLADERRARLQAKVTQARAWCGAHPRTAVLLAAAIAAIASSWPVVFAGRSYVSPNYGSAMLYDTYPTLPGYTTSTVYDVRGADIGAIAWQQIPMSFLQSQALLHDHELPLWNRYNSLGTVLLGQGQSMFGDPLHFGVILAGGASWAWDLKYLAAKILLGFGTGLVVWYTARHLAAALIVAFSSVFVGFFLFRVNHPAFFSFCYGPWILYAWCLVAGAENRREVFKGLLFLLLANWTMMNSGTAKEAYLSLITLNVCGAIVLLFAARPLAERLFRLGAAAAAGVAFAMITAPVWITFHDAIKSSYSSYNVPHATQVQPSLLVGFFDEVLLRPFMEAETVCYPSSNFLILLGVLAYLINLRGLAANRYALALGVAALVPMSFTFGLVPPLLIARIPFLANVHHIDNSFGLSFLHLSAVLAGFGFAGAARRLGEREGRGDLWLGALLLFALFFHYFAATQTVQRTPVNTYWLWGQYLHRSWFVWGTIVTLLVAGVTLAIVTRRMLVQRAVTAGALLVAATCVLLLLWRFGLQYRSQFPNYATDTGPRVQFDAPSPALTALHKEMKEPARVAGFAGNLFPGWSNVYRLEGITGPDALMNKHVRELQEAFGAERIWDWRLIFYPDTLAPVRPFHDLLNVRYYLDYRSDPGKLGAMLTPLAMGDLDLYRSETAWPRAFFTNRVTTYGSARDFANLVRSDSTRPVAAVQREDASLPSLPLGDVTDRVVRPASDYRITGNLTEFTVDAPSSGVVVLTEAWLKDDFVALLNGKQVPYFRVNHAFRGIVVPQGGTYRVSFRYLPHRFNLALGLCALGVALVAGAGFWVYRSTPRPA